MKFSIHSVFKVAGSVCGRVLITVAMLVMGIESLRADNPVYLPTRPDLTYDGEEADGSLTVDPGTTSIPFDSTATGTWEYKPVGGTTWSTISPNLTFPSPIGEGDSFTFDLRFTDPSGKLWLGTLTILTGFTDGSPRYDDAATDTGASPASSGCCTSSQCPECDEKSNSSDGTAPVDDASTADPYSLYETIALPVNPNDPDFGEGALMLYRTRITSSSNLGDRDLLRYAGIPTMRVLAEDDSPTDTSLVYTCTIRQASGFAVQFEIKSGENFGRPTGPYIHSGARIELLNSGGTVVSTPGTATQVRQYRQGGGTMVYDKTNGNPDTFTSRTGRVNANPAAEVEFHNDVGGKLAQVKTAAGLLVLDEVTSRKYTIKRYLPHQVSGSSAPYTTSGSPILIVTVDHPVSTSTVSITREIDGRKVLHDWEYSTAAAYNQWKLTRKIWNGTSWNTAWTKARKVTDIGVSNQIDRTWKDSAGAAFYSAAIATSSKAWNARTPSSGTATDGSRTLGYYTSTVSPGSYGKLSSKRRRDQTYEYYYHSHPTGFHS